MQVKIRRCQVIKLILTGFVVVQENIKPSVLMHRSHKLGLYLNDLGLYSFLYNTKPVSMRIVITETIKATAPPYQPQKWDTIFKDTLYKQEISKRNSEKIDTVFSN